MRSVQPFLVAVFASVAAVIAAGCDVQQALEQVAEQAARQGIQGDRPVTTSIHATAPNRGGETIRIASFNIQVFGQSKSDEPQVMDVLAKVVRRFDVVAIQEVRSKNQDVLPRFVELVNADGSRYDFVLGPRLGRTSSKEQYAFVFDASRVEVDRDSVDTVDDPEDLLHREPLVARFRVRGPPREQSFTFTLVNIHTDPDETDTELDALDDVFRSVQRDGGNEDDVILLGDLNVDHEHLGELGRLPGIAWVISGQPTNTRGNHSYDNVVFDQRTTTEYAGRSGVLNLMDEFGLTLDEALDVSDHMPVWAEFRMTEGRGGRLAETEQPAATR